ncbi:MAG: hypothetical protein OEV43_04975 [Coriobacteriia bacterium]|nr:hypothetical protein [Coriobacteriia bacterium]
MTPDTRLTVADIRHHAEEVRDLAQENVRRLAQEQATKAVIVGAIAVVAAISVAYWLGSRSARGCCVDQ